MRVPCWEINRQLCDQGHIAGQSGEISRTKLISRFHRVTSLSVVKTMCNSGRGRYEGLRSNIRWFIRIVRDRHTEWGRGSIITRSRRQHFRTMQDWIQRLWRTWTWIPSRFNDRRTERACYVVKGNDDLLNNNGLQSKRKLCSRSTRNLLDSVHQNWLSMQTLRQSSAL